MNNFDSLTDQKLFELCEMYGLKTRLWRQKFAGLLPEVNRRELYRRKGFASIFEFAAKLAGMSKEQVQRVLKLQQKFEKTPALQNLLVNGEVSVHKLARVASMASPENQKILANQVQMLSKSALETLVRDEKQMGLFEETKRSVPGHNFELQLSPAIKQQLLELQQKGIDINELLQQFLDQRQQKLEEEKEEVSRQQNEKTSRYIPVKVKKVLKQEYGTKCAMPTCHKPSKVIHHTRRFSLNASHDPHYLAPLCKDHHRIAHSIDVKCVSKIQKNKGLIFRLS